MRFALAFLALLLLIGADAQAAPSRIKDLIDVEGVRENQLVGYGLVVGLNLQSMLNRLGVKPTDKGTTSKNVAAVMVTAALPPFARRLRWTEQAISISAARTVCLRTIRNTSSPFRSTRRCRTNRRRQAQFR